MGISSVLGRQRLLFVAKSIFRPPARLHNSTYTPELMTTTTLGQERTKRRMKVIELKCELLHRAKVSKGGKKKKVIFLENQLLNHAHLLQPDLAVQLLVKACQRFQYKTPIRSGYCVKLAIQIFEHPMPSGRHIQAQMSCVYYVEFRITGLSHQNP